MWHWKCGKFSTTRNRARLISKSVGESRQSFAMCSKWCYVMVGMVLPLAGLAAIESCLGGRSVRGLSNLDRWSATDRSVSCCDDETVCHGGLALKDVSFTSPVGDSKLVRRYAQALESNDAHRHKRYPAQRLLLWFSPVLYTQTHTHIIHSPFSSSCS